MTATAVIGGPEIAWSMLAAAAVLGQVTVPGREESVRAARAFVGATLGPGHAARDDAQLLVSELVTNAIQHSSSGHPGGSVTIVVLDVGGGIRVEVIDEGPGHSVPVVRGEMFSSATSGRGLFLVQSMADDWGYVRGAGATTVWFRLPV
ncbi:MAG TPA: ATP-binding protein [Streptosporangiaceae bacterium]|nr:ATP-binding protein [Streptosporangiaceae bacterium]